MVSLSSNERASRINSFKHRISALRATTKAYGVCDRGLDSKSVGTLDSSLASSSCFSGDVSASRSYASATGQDDRRESSPVQSRASSCGFGSSAEREVGREHSTPCDSCHEGSDVSSCASVVGGSDAPSANTSEGSVDGALFGALMGKMSGQPAGAQQATREKTNPFCDSADEESLGRAADDESIYDADSPMESKSTKNPFDDDSFRESSVQHNTPKPAQQGTVAAIQQQVRQGATITKSNPYGVTPNPFDDSSIDESFIGTISSTLEDDAVSCKLNSNQSVVSARSIASGAKSETSLDGELFSHFRHFMRKSDDGAVDRVEGNADGNIIDHRSKMLDKKIDAPNLSGRKSVGSCDSSSSGGFSIESAQESVGRVKGKATATISKSAVSAVEQEDARKDDQIRCEAIDLIARLGKSADRKSNDLMPPAESTDNEVETFDANSPVAGVDSNPFDAESTVETSPKATLGDDSLVSSSDPAKEDLTEFDADESSTEAASTDSCAPFDSSGISPVAFDEPIEEEESNRCLPSDSIEEGSPSESSPTNQAVSISQRAPSPTKHLADKSFDSSSMDSSMEFEESLERKLNMPLICKTTTSTKKWAATSIHEVDSPIVVSSAAGKQFEVGHSDSVSVDSSSVISPEFLRKKSNGSTSKAFCKVTPSPKKNWKMSESFDTSSVASSFNSAPPQKEVKSINPFADILVMRAKERKENNWIVHRMMKADSNISQMDFESSSQEDSASNITPNAKQGKIFIENTHKVKIASSVSKGNDFSDASSSCSDSVSLQGTIFTDLRKALSNIQSVSYETNEESEEEAEKKSEDETNCKMCKGEINRPIPLQRSDDMSSRKPDFNGCRSDKYNVNEDCDAPPKHIISGESCAVSSLKTTEFKAAYVLGVDVNESFDDAEDVASVPRCPTSFEKIADELKDPENSGKELHEELKYANRVCHETLQRNTSSSESATADSSIHRVIKLSPPKKPVVGVLHDGSISTKDSIVGKTIRVTNADMVAERIYLESLRAQVHAELKVHVADEEIRLALEERLNAIRDFYKRKSTVAQLKPGHDNNTINEVPSFQYHTKCTRPKILRGGSIGPNSPQSFTDVSSLSSPKAINASKLPKDQNKLASPTEDYSTASLPLGATMNSSKENAQKHVFEQADADIKDALKAANYMSANQSELSKENVTEDEEGCINNLSSRVMPTKIYSKEVSSWDDEELMIHKTQSPKSKVCITAPAVKDAWIFYRQLNQFLSDSRIYDYEFQTIRKDPLYPYLNSLTGIADSGDDGTSAADKKVKQRARDEFSNKSPHRICHILSKEAKEIQPELIEVCEDIARKLNMSTMAVGPIKTASAALIKSEKKYGGNPLLVTDFCRVSLFVPDVATLLALIEIVLSKYAYIVKRIKLSNLKSEYKAITGGYRDCKINVDIEGHVCEIQVHLERLWNIKEDSGYIHYKNCFDNNVNDSSYDITRTLIGLDREFLSNLIKVGETAVKDLPVSDLEYDCENEIRDYCALANLYIYYGLPVRAEYTLRQIVKLRTENVLFGPDHAETVMLLKLLKKSLMMQHKYKSAMAVTRRINRAEKLLNDEEDIVGLCTGDHCGAIDHFCDSILDPSKIERLEEKERAKRVEDSRAIWLGTRKMFFIH